MRCRLGDRAQAEIWVLYLVRLIAAHDHLKPIIDRAVDDAPLVLDLTGITRANRRDNVILL